MSVHSWETARKKRCFSQFITLKCVKNDQKLDADGDNFNVSMLDERKMKTHILDCLAALGIVQQELDSQEQPSELCGDEQSLAREQQEASNKVFKATLCTMANAFLHDGSDMPKRSNSVDTLLRAFPDDSKLTDGRNWLPLHWAVVTDETLVTEEDVNVVYTSDPMALQRCHLDGASFYGYTPAHLLSMQVSTQRNMSLIRHFSVCNSRAFTMSASVPDIPDSDRGDPLLHGFSALHTACCHGQPTEELLQHLLQLDSSQTKKTIGWNGFTPLGYLCNDSNCSDDLITCLLEVDSSAEVVGDGIYGCLISSDDSRVLERVEMLLKANPEAAKHRDSYDENLLHLAVGQEKMSFQLFIDIMQRIVAIHKDAVREVNSYGWLPIHTAACYSTVEVMEFLLSLYPESVVITTDGSDNLLHMAVFDKESATTSVMEAKVRFLCSRYPLMMLQRDDYGNTPLHYAISSKNVPAVQILCEAGGQDQVRLPVAHPTDDSYGHNGWLPLHYLVDGNVISLRDSLLSEVADCFRMLPRCYPEAAGIEDGVVDVVVEDEAEDENENDPVKKKTPYQLAVDLKIPPYYLRLLLRAVPNLDPTELHRMNYAERRMAMFLAFKAVTSQKKPVLLKRLCFDNKELVKHVISFL